jgi:hypothetical protein
MVGAVSWAGAELPQAVSSSKLGIPASTAVASRAPVLADLICTRPPGLSVIRAVANLSLTDTGRCYITRASPVRKPR